MGYHDRIDLDAIAALHLALWPTMPTEWRQHWREQTRHCLKYIPMTGAADFQINDTMRSVICAHLGLATLGLGTEVVADLHGITVYPDEFWVDEIEEDELTGVISESRTALSGQAIGHERIVLSWQDVLASRPSATDPHRRYNVVIHEFTHHLQASRPYGDPQALRQLEVEYERFQQRAQSKEDAVLDSYGAQSLEEFLATAAEAFFQEPSALERHHPVLFDLLTRSFKLNPLTWT